MTSKPEPYAQRIVQYRFGDPHEVLRVEDSPAATPRAAGDVLVRVTRTIIHPGDLQLVAAKYSQPPQAIPNGRVPGLEAVGIVTDAFPGTLDGTGFAIGTRVAFFAPGAWQTYAVVPASALVAVPDDIPDGVATQLLINTITARHVLRTGLYDLPRQPRSIVQTGAASAVGKLIAAFALQDGLHPIRLVRSPASATRLAEILPGGDILDTTSEGWQAAVRKAAQGDVPLVLDGVGGALIAEMALLLNTKGVLVSYGLLAGDPADLTMFIPKALTLRGATLGTWRTDARSDEVAMDMVAAIEIARSAPQIFAEFREFELSDLDAAIGAVTAPGKTGNVILKF